MIKLAVLGRLEEYRKLHHRMMDVVIGLTGVAHGHPVVAYGQFDARAKARTSAGLDPISSRLLDELILELRDSLGATVVVVTHELASIFTIGNNSVFLDPDAKTMTASGDPKELLAHCPDPKVRAFLRRGEKEKS